jgi:transposase
MTERANSPATRRERLLELICSRNQGQPFWTAEELAAELCTSVRTIERWREWLRDTGRLPLPRNLGGSPATNIDESALRFHSSTRSNKRVGTG